MPVHPRHIYQVVLGVTRAAVFAVCSTLLMMLSLAAHGYQAPANLVQGLNGSVQLGALSTFGPTDSNTLSARTTYTYRTQRWEHELDAKLLRSSSEQLVIRLDANGDTISDAQGEPVKDLITNTTSKRGFVSAQSRFFLSEKTYLFGVVDYETNKPANIDKSTRQIAGFGYKLWRSKSDQLGAEIGVGRKSRFEVDGSSEEDPIGYLGFIFRRNLSKKSSLAIELDSDFASDNRYTEADITFKWSVRNPLSIKLRYEARFNSTVTDPLNTFADGLEAALSINIAVDVF